MVRKQTSDVWHDSRFIVVCLLFGGMGVGITNVLFWHGSWWGVIGGLWTGALGAVCYLAWRYGRDRYLRWFIARHTYRPPADR